MRPEGRLQSDVIAFAKRTGWIVHHTPDGTSVRRVPMPGFPDLALAHKGMGRFMLRELKSDSGSLSADQENWLEIARLAGVDVGVWRPRDWPDRVVRELQHG